MAITISLYQISEPENVFPKTLGTAVATHTITLKDGCSIDKPTVSFSGTSTSMATLNYAYIDAFGRYYFIRDRNMTVNGVCELTLESDPLQSFATEISSCSTTIARSETEANGYINDPQYTALAYQKIASKNFPISLDDFSYILMTVG